MICVAALELRARLGELALPQHAAAPPFEQWLDDERRWSAGAFAALEGGVVVGYARLGSEPLPAWIVVEGPVRQ